MSDEFVSPTEPDNYPPHKSFVFTPEYIAWLWDTYQVAPSLLGGYFQSGHYELAKEFPRFRRTDLFDWLDENKFELMQEISHDRT